MKINLFDKSNQKMNIMKSFWRLLVMFIVIVFSVSTILAADIIKNNITGDSKIFAAEYDVNASYFQGNNLALNAAQFKEFSQAYKGEETFASQHQSDSITITAGGALILDQQYASLGTNDYPFKGNINFSGINSTVQRVVEDKPFFDYVYDSVKIKKSGSNDIFGLEIIRSEDVGNNTTSTLFANEVFHDDSQGAESAQWIVTLTGENESTGSGYENIHSHSGLIGKINDGAKVNISFTDDSEYRATYDNLVANGGVWLVSNTDNIGIICGEIVGSASLDLSYTNNQASKYTYIKGKTNAGGLVGKLTNANGNSPKVVVSECNNLNIYIENDSSYSGFICGFVDGLVTKPASLEMPDNLEVKGTIAGSGSYSGGIAGGIKNGDIKIGDEGDGTYTLDSAVINGASSIGGIVGWFIPHENNTKIITSAKINLKSTDFKGGSSGGLVGRYDAYGNENINIDNKVTYSGTAKITAGNGGAIIGNYNTKSAIETTTISGSQDTAPKVEVDYGGVIGTLTLNQQKSTIKFEDINVDNINYTANGSHSVGGVVGQTAGFGYIEANNISITNVATPNMANQGLFGGLIGKSNGSNNKGCFLNIKGDIEVTTKNSYKGGAICGSLLNGVLRLSKTTDISGAAPQRGYAQLVYKNDNTIIYALGNGQNNNWKIIRNTSAWAPDLGDNGEVIRMFNGDDIETAGIVDFDQTNHVVTLQAPVLNVSNEVQFAKLALNMQLNDGIDHGSLKFADTSNKRSVLLAADITINGTIDLSGTGIIALTRDGGVLYKTAYSTNFNNSNKADRVFTGTITGENAAKIILAAGECYGFIGSDGTTGSTESQQFCRGLLYSSHSNNVSNIATSNCHRLIGLVALADSAQFSNLTISGIINNGFNIQNGDNTTNDIDNCLGLLVAYGNGNNQFTNIKSKNMEITINHNTYYDRFYIGGLVGKIAGTTGGQTLVDTCDIDIDTNLRGDSISNNTRLRFGGITGAIEGETNLEYKLDINDSKISPHVAIQNTSNNDYCYISGIVSDIPTKNTYRKVNITNTKILDASLENGSVNPGGFLGISWIHTDTKISNLEIEGSKIVAKSSNNKQIGGLLIMGSGRMDIDGLAFKNSSENVTKIQTSDNNITSVGMVASKAYYNDDGLYINIKNENYEIDEKIEIPEKGYVDEIAAQSATNVINGGTNTGIISINMNEGSGTDTKITTSGTYQNKYFKTRIPNSNSRYYYNLDIMEDEGYSIRDGEKFLFWTCGQYVASNLKKYFTRGSYNNISDIDLRGLSYYPINLASDITMPQATVTLDFKQVKNAENTNDSDSYKRYPDDNGADTKNQHYLMQTGIFRNITGTFANSGKLTLKGDFGYINNEMMGALAGGNVSGTINISNGISINNLQPSNAASSLLINKIDGSDTKTPVLKIDNLRLTGYTGDLPVATALINTALGTDMNITFSDIKMDARDGNSFSDPSWTSAAATAMDEAYGTSRSIFSSATFFNSLSTDNTSVVEYNYKWAEDWGDDNERKVTYGKEITTTINYRDEDNPEESGEDRYNKSDGKYTNPVSGVPAATSSAYDFSTGFLPHVAAKANNNTTTYPIFEVKVNYSIKGLENGCGTYNDPYIIDNASILNKVAAYINSDSGMLGSIRLPNQLNATWHTEEKGDSIYEKDGDSYESEDANAIDTWDKTSVRKYLAGAYYLISDDITLKEDFPGIGIGGTNENGDYIFHGVIVGKKADGSKPEITNPTSNPFIKISNGAVVKNVDFKATKDFTLSQSLTGSNARFGYGRITNEAAVYYGNVMGEIMGGDNIIDNVNVDCQGDITLSGTYANTIPVGAYVGAIVNGGLIFRNMTGLTSFNACGLSVKNSDTELVDNDKKRGLYVNPIVGRVLNGYAINEGSASINNGDKHYSIDKVNKTNENKLNVSLANSTISIPDAQAMFVLSLITQSTAGLASTQNGSYNGKSFSYGVASSDFLVGIIHYGDYNDVGAKDNNGIITSISETGDYNLRAKSDTSLASNDTRNNSSPYIISNYTQGDARCVTKANTYFKIELTGNSEYDLQSNFPSFRGIGCIGNTNVLYNVKLKEFNGNGKTIKVNIKHTRFGLTKENYYYGCVRSENPKEGYANNINTYTFTGQDGIQDARLAYQSQGVGLFDNITSEGNNDDKRAIFKNFTLKGSISDIVYDTSKDEDANDTGSKYPQRFSAGGVLGMAYHGSVVGFNDIIIDDIYVESAFSSGGLAGLVAMDDNSNNHYTGVRINRCATGDTGITIVGGYNPGLKNGSAGQYEPRQGSGGFLGMVVKSRTEINTQLNPGEEDNIYTIKIRKITNYAPDTELGTTRMGDANSAGIIGYGGTGMLIRNMAIVGIGNDAFIGDADKTGNASGIVAFAQNGTDGNNNYPVLLENCSVSNININSHLNSAGLFSKGMETGWATSYCHITNCSVSGDLDANGDPKYQIYSKNASYSTAGGLIASARAASTTASSCSQISSSYIKGYTIQSKQAGGLAGNVKNKPLQLKDSYIKDCIITSTDVSGGFVGYLENSVVGYNLMTRNVVFTNSNCGQYIGNANSKLVKLVGVNKYADQDKSNTFLSKDIYQNSSNADNFIVNADYLEKSAQGIANPQSEAYSSLGSAENVEQALSPYLTTNPKRALGTGEYITSDAAAVLDEDVEGYESYSSAKTVSARIYKDLATSSNRRYKNVPDEAKEIMEDYLKSAAGAEGFKVSTWNTEARNISGVDDFSLLVIDENNRSKITKFIDSYIKLVTNTNPSSAQGYGLISSDNYKISLNACKYDSNQGKFILGDENESSIQWITDAYGIGYEIRDSKADSTSGNQFTLLDVKFLNPIDTSQVAYHVYVPIYVKKSMEINFKAVSLSGTEYLGSLYTGKIASELASGKNASDNPSTLVESTDAWTTSYIRFEYPISEINEMLKTRSDFMWNHDKAFTIRRTQEDNIPANTKFVLMDVNNNKDKVYYAKAGDFDLADDKRVIELSTFKNGETYFHEQTLKSLLDKKIIAEDSNDGCYELADGQEGQEDVFTITLKNGEEHSYKYVGFGGDYNLVVDQVINEDYYFSMYVPKEVGGADVVRLEAYKKFAAVDGNGSAKTNGVMRANVTSLLDSLLVLGDFFEHVIKRLDVLSEADNVVISESNKTLKITTKAKIKIKNDQNQATFFRDNLETSADHIYHSFNILLNRYSLDADMSDLIKGVKEERISTTYKIFDNEENSIRSASGTKILASNYIQVTTGDIKSILLQSPGYDITIEGNTRIIFDEFPEEFPPNPEERDKVGVQGRVKSSIAYRQEELPYTKMYAEVIESPIEDKTAGDYDKFYYTKELNKAKLAFNAVDQLDEEAIGKATFNMSRLGVNSLFTYDNELAGKAVYNLSELGDSDYASAEKVRYTVQLYKKITENDGTTSYNQVTGKVLYKYLDNISLVDTQDGIDLRKITVEDGVANYSDGNQVVFEGEIDHSNTADADKMFTSDFNCTILKNDGYEPKDYTNYRIMLKAEVIGTTSSTAQQDYIVYTHAKIDPEMLPIN